MPGGGHRQSSGPWIRGPRALCLLLTGLKEDAPPSRPCSALGSLPAASSGELIAPRESAGLSHPGQPLSRSFRQALWERPACWRQAVGGP